MKDWDSFYATYEGKKNKSIEEARKAREEKDKKEEQRKKDLAERKKKVIEHQQKEAELQKKKDEERKKKNNEDMMKFAQTSQSTTQGGKKKKSSLPREEGEISPRDQGESADTKDLRSRDTAPLKKVLYEKLQKLKEDTKKGVAQKKEVAPKMETVPKTNPDIVQAPTPVASWWRTTRLQKRAIGKPASIKSQESKQKQAERMAERYHTRSVEQKKYQCAKECQYMAPKDSGQQRPSSSSTHAQIDDDENWEECLGECLQRLGHPGPCTCMDHLHMIVPIQPKKPEPKVKSRSPLQRIRIPTVPEGNIPAESRSSLPRLRSVGR